MGGLKRIFSDTMRFPDGFTPLCGICEAPITDFPQIPAALLDMGIKPREEDIRRVIICSESGQVIDDLFVCPECSKRFAKEKANGQTAMAALLGMKAEYELSKGATE